MEDIRETNTDKSIISSSSSSKDLKVTHPPYIDTEFCSQESLACFFLSPNDAQQLTQGIENSTSGKSFEGSMEQDFSCEEHFFYAYSPLSIEEEKINQYVDFLNHTATYAQGLQGIFDEAKKGNWNAICFLFDEACDRNRDENYKRLFPDKTAGDLLLKDFQKDGLNENAFEYYLYQLRPEKEELAPALVQALNAGFQKVDIFENIMWQLFNDINGVDHEEEKTKWIKFFKSIQCRAYALGLVDQISNPFVTGRLY